MQRLTKGKALVGALKADEDIEAEGDLVVGGNLSVTGSQITADGVGAKNGATVAISEQGGVVHRTVFTLTDTPVTLVLNGTATAGGGTKIYDYPAGLILPIGATSDLTVANAIDASFVASLGTAAAGTDGTLSSTEANHAPSTAATTTSGVGTCKMKSTVTVPTPGAPIDGTGTAVDLYLNFALNADGTGGEDMTASGTITLFWINLGDN